MMIAVFIKYVPVGTLKIKMSIDQGHESRTPVEEDAEKSDHLHHLKSRRHQGARCFTVYLLVPLKESIK